MRVCDFLTAPSRLRYTAGIRHDLKGLGVVKKETLITAAVFLGVGFLAGFAFNAHRSARQRAAAVAASGSSAQAQAAASADSPSASGASAALGGSDAEISSQLPKGHPALTDAEVVQFFTDDAAHNPSDPAPRLKLADFLYDRHHFDQAIPWYRQALALDPKDVDARTDMATCYFSLGNAREAVIQLNDALNYDPHHGPTLFNLAVVNMEGAHNYPAARMALRRLAAVNPSYPGLGPLKQALDAASSASDSAATP